jgi:hypothetical protein
MKNLLKFTKKTWLTIAKVILIVIIIVLIIFILWALQRAQADTDKLAIARDENQSYMTITEKPTYWELTPKLTFYCPDSVGCTQNMPNFSDTAFIFYPGAKVDPQAYFYKLSPLVNGKYLRHRVFVTKPPLNLAIFGINQADQIIGDHPEVQSWAIGGHSLGGAMSCEYAKNHVSTIKTLVLLSAYCSSNISTLPTKVISIHGSQDGLATPTKVSSYRKNLPQSALDYQIDGMNHAQVGNYGAQSGDYSPKTSDDTVLSEITLILRVL